MKQYFNSFAMIRPQNDRDISAMLSEALAELQSINSHLELLTKIPVGETA